MSRSRGGSVGSKGLKSLFVLISLITMATAVVELIANVTAKDTTLFIKKKNY